MKSNEAYEAEIERLKLHIEIKNRKIESLYALISANRKEGIKEYAERLKRKSELMAMSVYAAPERAVFVSDIDNLVKEMTEKEVQP